MEFAQKTLKLAEIYGIGTAGKTEEELKQELQAQILKLAPASSTSSSSESTIVNMARSFGKMMGEWERAKVEFSRSIESGTQAVTTPITELKVNADNLLKVAKGLGVSTQGMTIDAIRNEVRRIIRI